MSDLGLFVVVHLVMYSLIQQTLDYGCAVSGFALFINETGGKSHNGKASEGLILRGCLRLMRVY